MSLKSPDPYDELVDSIVDSYGIINTEMLQHSKGTIQHSECVMQCVSLLNQVEQRCGEKFLMRVVHAIYKRHGPRIILDSSIIKKLNAYGCVVRNTQSVYSYEKPLETP
jgi:hypothetical protein